MQFLHTGLCVSRPSGITVHMSKVFFPLKKKLKQSKKENIYGTCF